MPFAFADDYEFDPSLLLGSKIISTLISFMTVIMEPGDYDVDIYIISFFEKKNSEFFN